MEFEELLTAVGEMLDRLHIPYCITGGYAVSVWGRPRGTFDIDVVVKLEVKAIRPLADSLRKLSRAGYIDEGVAKNAVQEGKEFNYFHPESGIKLDFWAVANSDAAGRRELERRLSRKIGKRTVYFISPEDLILSKLKWFKKTDSTRQLEDIESVIKIQKKLDLAYLRRESRADATDDILEPMLKKND